jgi:lysophospholipase L1-like esterase
VAAAEGLLRLAGLTPVRGGVFTVSAEEFDRIPGIFEPGQDAEVEDLPFLPYHARIDSLGYRGADFARRPSEDEFRVLVVGGSMVFGSFVGDDETLPARLEAALREHCSKPVRVINAGLGGSTISDHAHLIERALVLEPDLVVLQFGPNDVRNLVGPSAWDELARNREAKSRFPLGPIYPLIRNSGLWNLALRVRATFQSQRAEQTLARADSVAPEAPRRTLNPRPMPDARAEYRRRLERLRDEMQTLGLPFAMTIFPSHNSTYRHWDWDQVEWIEGVTRELQLDAVSFLDTLVADGRPETELDLVPLDGHPSPTGYEVAARHLAGELIQRGLMGRGCA